jgi:subtilisin-like proprotein convertase family protein
VLQTNAAIQGALICNNSWGNGDEAYDLSASSYDAATRDAIPERPGSQPVLFVFAAGNNGNGNNDGASGDYDSVSSPGTAKNVITVGAIEQLRNITNIVTVLNDDGSTNYQGPYWQAWTDSGSQVAWYSARGNVGVGTEGTYGRFKPDVVTPGTFVVSTRSTMWNTNAYYSNTNAQTYSYPYQPVAVNALNLYPVTVPPNAVGVNINVTANKYSPNPFPPMPLYANLSAAPTTNDYVGTNTFVIPPGANGVTLASIVSGGGFYFSVGNPTNRTVNYDVTVTVYVTNNLGDRMQVLERMNDSLGGFYRYETGTSMSAAAVSGLLALMQDYFTNTLHTLPSPALLKAMLINGARQIGGNKPATTNQFNFDGWGLPNLANSLPVQTNSVSIGTNSQLFFVDQNVTNALATGDAHTYLVTINTNSLAPQLNLRTTLVWTDPPGDPNAAIKLVNNLDLIVTNLDTGSVYYGNDFSGSTGFSQRWNTNATPNLDIINNVRQVILPPLLAGHYSVTVLGRLVNVNAVTAQTNNTVQDFALVVSCTGGLSATNAFTATDGGLASNPTGYQDITFVTTTNTPLFNQFAGENTPLLGTNNLPIGGNTMWGSNGVVTLGMTNQWHFYVVTNTVTAAIYAGFVVFNSDTLAIPRMGTLADSTTDATRPEADIDMYVSTDASLTNLNPAVISSCLAGTVTATANSFGASLGQGGTEFVTFSNSAPGQVYYIGVKSEDHMAAEYAFLPIFSAVPFSQIDKDGNQIVNGMFLPVSIPDGGNPNPGLTNVFALAIYPMQIAKVIVTNLDEHENAGDLFGALSFGGTYDILNDHNLSGNTFGTLPLVYDDSRNPIAGSVASAGPGSLVNFRGKSAPGLFILSEEDDANTATGRVSVLTMKIQPHRDLKKPGIQVVVPAGGWFIDYVDVPPGYTNLTFFATNLPPTAVPPIQMYEKLGNEPTTADYDQRADLTNGVPPGNLISVGPPLDMGRYFIGLFNPSSSDVTVLLSATLGFGSGANNTFSFASDAPAALLDDAVSSSAITVPNSVTQLVASVSVGMVVNSPRISDYTFTLVSPTGQRVLLMENRGGTDTNGAGMEFIYTNVINSTATGDGRPDTNYLAVPSTGITVPITYNFYTVPDEMTVYGGTNSATFNTNSPDFLYDTGFTNNAPAGGGGGAGNTTPTTINVNVPPGYDFITIIMNQFGNPFASAGDAWIYTAGAPVTNYEYLVFTDDTNLSNVPIKFAAPPFSLAELATNFTLCDFELATNGLYHGPTNIPDAFGGWTLPTNLVTVSTVFNLTNQQFVQVTNVTVLTNNQVSVVADPSDSIGDNTGTNLLALAYGTITRNIATTPGRIYNVTFWFRGPGINGWWRGEGDATDSSDPEKNANNGRLVGRFNFPAGEVGQAFGFEDSGEQFEFAGTNTYVQIPQSTSLDVGKGGGFTVEGWINPTNLFRPQPLVEWLAKVPTNSTDTNFNIVAGPYLDPATGHYYYLLGATNATTSEAWATALGGHLATVNSANEQNWIFDNFANYGDVNHNLWIGLTNTAGTAFGWSSGETNGYTNWLSGQPLNTAGARNYTFIRGNTNSPSGLWVCANNNGFTQTAPTSTNIVYGVAEVNQIQTNGVQFWVSATSSMPGGTNTLVNTNGCLYANLIDVSNVWHEIYSAPGLLQSNVFQHVALTFDTNSGLAKLYFNGTNVATTNLFMPGGVFTPFVPKTDGDLLLGRDLTLYTNNYFGGRMDEMSIYSRALSDAEIAGIYRISATATNGLTGKFDPATVPEPGLAEAAVVFGSDSNIIFGVNNQWEVNSYTFTATSNMMPLRITGLQPGILLDDFAVSQAPLTNIYYLPEQSLNDTLAGDAASGTWTMQVWDNRVGAYVTNLTQLVSWDLNFILQSNVQVAAALSPQTPTPITVGPGQIVSVAVTVPSWASYATNILVSSTVPVDLFFNQTNPPTATVPPDYQLLNNVSSGIGLPVLSSTNPPSVPPLLRGQTYYLGVRNTNTTAASVVLEVDFDITGLTNGVPYASTLTTNDALRYFSFAVTSNAYAATFQLLQMSGNADLVLRKGVPLPNLTNTDYGSFNATNADENIFVLTNSSPVPLTAGTWYLGVFRRDSGAVNYTVLAKELDTPTPNIIDLTNAAPFNFTAGPGAALTNFFRFGITNNPALTNAHSVRFELYNLSGNGDLTVQTNAPPLAPPFFESSQNVGRSPEMIWVATNGALTNFPANWYLGVPNHEITSISYTIVATIDTNGYFPAFPGAEGTGGGAFGGGRLGYSNTVYHVTTLADSGFGSLRDAVSSTNRTVVFDVSGTIHLLSRLVITNSFLTLAGQTAPGDGVTVADWETSVTNAHDLIIRYLRFRPGNTYTNTTTVWFNGFEGGVSNSTPTNGNYFAGWSVDAGSVDWLTNGTFSATAYSGGYFIDLNGDGPGVISTNVPTVVGMQYAVNFAYARNPDAASEQAAVLADGQVLGTVTAANANSWANLGWQTAAYSFTATSNATHLMFMSTNTAGLSGVLLDAVSLTTNQVVTAAPGDALRFITASNVIVDHVTATWAPRQVVSVLDSTNFTMQWSVISQQLYDTNGLGDGSQLRAGNGALSFHHNLYADNNAGSPHLADNINLDFVNNVIYNWGTNSGFAGDDTNNLAGYTNQMNFTGNYLIAGTNSFQPWIAFRSATSNTWIFQTNNFIDSTNDGVLNGGNTQWNMFTNLFTNQIVKLGQPLPLVRVSTDEAYQAYERVLAFAGASLMQRDSADTNLVTGVRQQNGQIISSQNQVGGFPSLNSTAPWVDTDADGIPDYWEITFFGTYPNPTNSIGWLAATNVNSLGYTRLEEYLNWLGAPHALTVTNAAVAVDLYKLTGNSGNLAFFTTNAVNGTVYLTNVLNGVTNTGPFSNSIAIFTPTNTTPAFTGYASFDYYVTNTDTVAYFGPVAVSVVVSGVPISPIITLTNLMPYTNQTTYSGFDYYRYNVSTNCYGVKFEILNPSGDVNLYASFGLPLPLVSNPIFDSSTNPGTNNELILVLTNTAPVPFTNGWWYLTVSNASGGLVNYTILATELVAPVFIYSPTNTSVFELTQLTVTNTAITYAPGHSITYTNFLTIDTNAMNARGWTNPFANVTNTQPAIDTNGVITWTPSEAQGPGVYTLTTIAFDTNAPATSSTNSFSVIVYEVNTAPYWPTNTPSQTNYTIPGLTTLVVTNTALDADLPTNLLTYNLTVTLASTNFPVFTNAVIDTNGIITWTPTLAQSPGVYLFTTIVTDTNAYALTNRVLSATNQFTVTVTPVALPFAFTHPAQSTTGTNAQLDGMVSPNGLPTTAWFQWGTSTNYGLVTPPSVVGSNFNFNVIYTATTVTGLTVNLPYHYRLVVSNAVGVTYGFDQIFDQGNLVAWGADFLGQTVPIPPVLTNLVAAIGAGYDFSLALNNNGTVVAWGDGIFGQTNVPPDLTNAVSVSGGYKDGLALRRDHTVTVWGSSQFKQTGTNVPANLTNAVLAVSGDWHCLALRDDGTVLPWGNNSSGQTNIPVGLSNVVSIASGGFHSLALKNDGTVVAWGDSSYGQTNVPAGLSNVVAVAGGESHSLALKNDGTLIAWGDNTYGQTNVPAGSNFIAIACGGFHSLALRNDGTVQQWGDSSAGQSPVFAATLTNVFAIAGAGGGGFHSLALSSLYGLNQTNNAPFWTNSSPTVTIFLVTNQTANVSFTNAAADTNVPAQILSYKLLNPPSWANIGQYTGIITFTNVEPQGVGVTTILTNVVTDNGYPALSTTNTVTVLVYEINTPPFWPPGVPGQTNYVINAANTLTVADTASDADLPANPLKYSVSVSGGVTNVFINPTNGIFTWTPSPAQVSGTNYAVTVTVTDTNAYALTNQTLSATNTFTVTVLPPLTLTNGTPLTNVLAGNSVEFFLVPVPTNADFATNRLLFATPAGVNVWFTTNAPPSVGATNDALLITNSIGNSAVIGTANVPLQFPNSLYWLGVQNTNSFAVTNALEVDFHLLSSGGPVNFASIIYTNIAGTNGFLLTWFAPSNDLFQVQWTPSLAPTNWTTFTNPPVISFNTNIVPVNPANAQFNFFDDGSQTGGFGTNRFYRLLLLTNAPNTAPAFVLNGAQFFVTPTYAFALTNAATDSDVPAQTLVYSLLSATTAVSFNTTNGAIVWTPTLAQAGTTNTIKTIVTDSGTPPLSATNTIFVIANPLPVLGSVTFGTNGMTLQWSGWTNEQFEVQWTTNLPPSWTIFPGIITSTNGQFTFLDTNAPFLTKFYQLILLP